MIIITILAKLSRASTRQQQHASTANAQTVSGSPEALQVVWYVNALVELTLAIACIITIIIMMLWYYYGIIMVFLWYYFVYMYSLQHFQPRALGPRGFSSAPAGAGRQQRMYTQFVQQEFAVQDLFQGLGCPGTLFLIGNDT